MALAKCLLLRHLCMFHFSRRGLRSHFEKGSVMRK